MSTSGFSFTGEVESESPVVRNRSVSLCETKEDLIQGHRIAIETFGHQTNDRIWQGFNPGWDTPEGEAAGARRLVERWEKSQAADQKDQQGRPFVVFLKATAPDPADGKPVVAGLAIWVQASAVEGKGAVPVLDVAEAQDLNELWPGNDTEHQYLRQAEKGLHRRRNEVIREKATEDPPAVFALDMCVVDPRFQRRGISQSLVKWGIEEAKARNGLECVTEASSMGRGSYAKLGFKWEGEEPVDSDYGFDDRFKDRPAPPNLFMRTGFLTKS
ncbi:hypothetical protein PoMZ_08094 [Pyricularia oryzae]|uniref:N-acetyltransferase domain-containing protein n=1 Tax=Pyricularia oryzae TaxID=318829 RepID=A0A4V1C6U9_PYROR|nr:hypothetical protein PoMZ_08094 [Pyricularia oryzae]